MTYIRVLPWYKQTFKDREKHLLMQMEKYFIAAKEAEHKVMIIAMELPPKETENKLHKLAKKYKVSLTIKKEV